MKFVNEDSEIAIVCQMVIDNSIIPNVLDEITQEDIYTESAKQVFMKISELNARSILVDRQVIRQSMKNINPATLEMILDATGTAANWKYYATVVKENAAARKFTALIGETAFMPNGKDSLKAINTFLERAAKIADTSNLGSVQDIQVLIPKAIEKIESAYKNKGNMSGLSTGFINIDEITDGLQNEYIVLAARPSIGKTALAMNMATHISQTVPVAYFSLEMSGESMALRIIAEQSKVQASFMRSGLLKPAAFAQIQEACTKLYDKSRMKVISGIKGDIIDIVTKIRKLVRCDGVGCIFIDHMSLVSHPNNKLQRFIQFTEISNMLQALQRELGIPIIVLSQVGREAENRPPTIADLRESGTIEQDADIIMLMDRERSTDTHVDCVDTHVLIAKNRNGPCGMAELVFMPKYIKFVDKETR
jgi:replicative DNA helicase